jgi:NAD(P)-dependent dehydrogenase (short-subunit alcohol dehydrogenase family)
VACSEAPVLLLLPYGAACCRLLAREGWAVAVNHRATSRDAAHALVQEITHEVRPVR